MRKIAEGAALMTGTTRRGRRADQRRLQPAGQRPAGEADAGQLDRLGPPPFDAADREAAAQFQATPSPEDISWPSARWACR